MANSHPNFEKNTSKQGTHFQIGMTWRTDKKSIPNNKVVAEKRLSYLKRKLQSNSDLHSKYTGAIKLFRLCHIHTHVLY